MTDKPEKPPKCSIDGENFEAGIWIFVIIVCAFLVGVITATLTLRSIYTP